MLSFDCTTMKWLAANPARLRPLSLAFILLPLAVGMPAPPAAAQYSYTTINPPPSLAYYFSPLGVNDSGTVVGWYFDQNRVAHGFIWTGGNNFTPFDYPGDGQTEGLGTYAYGINSSGVIAGLWYDSLGNGHGFEGPLGNFTSFDVPGATCGGTQPAAINNLGATTGTWWDANCVAHGFIDSSGAITSFDFPGAAAFRGTFPSGINDSGKVVGTAYPSTGIAPFLYTGGVFSTPTLPDGTTFYPIGIDNGGDLAAPNNGGLLLANGRVTPIYPPGCSPSSSGLQAISSSGNDILGGACQGWFLASAYSLLDPVPDLMVGPAVEDETGLASSGLGGRPIQGVAADGVTEAVIRIPAANVGDQFTITLLNDQQAQSSSPFQDGVLGTPGGSTFTQSQITVSAIGVSAPGGSQQPFAFAIYVAPVDFARPTSDVSYMNGSCNGGPSKPDNQLACRTVYLQIEGAGSGTLPITILRPPVVMIHGLWSNWQTWNNFSPLVTGPNSVNPLFSIGRVSYDNLVGPSIVSSATTYPPSWLLTARANSLGFSYNAPSVLKQAKDWIDKFRHGKNPAQVPAAVVQADIVAHSMGGEVARALVLAPDFLQDSNFGQGYIHKLISIGAPHRGSPLATTLLSAAELGGCVEQELAYWNVGFVFRSVSFLPKGSASVTGAIADLDPSSIELYNLAAQILHPIPTAFIAAINPNFDTQPLISHRCSSDPLGAALVSGATWAAEFNYQGQAQPNDAIVPETSALNGLPENSGFVFPGVVHTAAAVGTWLGLGFKEPSMLAPDSSQDHIPTTVIQLLNTPVTNNAWFYPLNP